VGAGPIAREGDPKALYFMADAYANGLGGVKADLDQAIQYCQQSSDAGYEPAAYLLAQLYGAKGKQTKAEQYYEQAATFGDTDAMRFLLDPSRSDFKLLDPTMAEAYFVYGTIARDSQITRMLAANRLLGRIGTASPDDDDLCMYLLAQAAPQPSNDQVEPEGHGELGRGSAVSTHAHSDGRILHVSSGGRVPECVGCPREGDVQRPKRTPSGRKSAEAGAIQPLHLGSPSDDAAGSLLV
jgi:tetratricopeptide (TPR) repeat protein